MLEARIQHHFSVTADALYQALGALAPSAEQATQQLLSALTNGAKVWVAGVGGAHVAASALVAGLWHGLGTPRPAFAAMLLSQGLGASPDAPRQWLTPLGALGQPGDVLWLWVDATPVETAAWQALAQVARERELALIWVGPSDWGLRAALVQEGELWLPLATQTPAAWMTQCVTLAHAVCDGLDAMLLGDGPQWTE